MVHQEFKSDGLVVRIDRFIEWVLPPLKTATIAAVPVAATGHLGPLPTLGLAALDSSLEFCHGLVHPLSHDGGQRESTVSAVTDSSACASPQETMNAPQSDSPRNGQDSNQDVPSTTINNAVDAPAKPQSEPQQQTAPTEQTPAMTGSVDQSQDVRTEFSMGL